MDDFVSFTIVFGIGGDGGRARVRAGHERCHVGGGERWKNVRRINDASAFGDELFQVGWLIPFDVVGAEAVGGEEQKVFRRGGVRAETEKADAQQSDENEAKRRGFQTEQ